MYKFIMMIGLPGSLKTTYAKGLLHKGKGVYLSSDDIRQEFNFEPNETIKTFDIMQKRLKELLELPFDIIYDATNLNRKFRRNVLNIVNKSSITRRKYAYFLALPHKVCIDLNNQRSGKEKVPDYVYDRMLRSFDFPFELEGFNEVIKVGLEDICQEYLEKDDYSNISLKESFKSCDIKDMINFNQDNIHHSFTLDGHTEKCINYIKDNYKYFNERNKKILELAAKYHDCGKLITKKYETYDGQPSKTAHYYGHENVGAYLVYSEFIYNNDFCQYYHDFSFIEKVAKLVAFHMKPSFSWKDAPYGKATLRDKQLFDVNELLMLELLGEADRQAH